MTVTTKTEAKDMARGLIKEAQALADKWGFNIKLNGRYSGTEYVPTHVVDSEWTESDAQDGNVDGLDYWTSSNEGSWVSSSEKCY